MPLERCGRVKGRLGRMGFLRSFWDLVGGLGDVMGLLRIFSRGPSGIEVSYYTGRFWDVNTYFTSDICPELLVAWVLGWLTLGSTAGGVVDPEALGCEFL